MTTEIESLLAEAPWLARLARRLTGGASEGEDIVKRPMRPFVPRPTPIVKCDQG